MPDGFGSPPRSSLDSNLGASEGFWKWKAKARGSPKPSDPCCVSEGWGQPNDLVVSGGCDKELRVWDVKSGYCIYVLRGHASTVRCLKLLPHTPLAISGSRDRTLRIWDIQTGLLVHTLSGHSASVRCLDVCPYTNTVVSGSYDTTCRVWSVETGECVSVLRGHYHQVYCVAFAKEGKRVVSGGLDTCVRVWDVEMGTCVALLQGHTALVCQLQLTPTMLATGGSDGRVITFSLDGAPSSDSSEYRVVQKIAAHDSSVTGLQLDDRFMVTSGNDGRVRLYEFQYDHHAGVEREGEEGKGRGNVEYVRELSEPSESIWKMVFNRETCAIMSKRAGKTVMEIWSFKSRT